MRAAGRLPFFLLAAVIVSGTALPARADDAMPSVTRDGNGIGDGDGTGYGDGDGDGSGDGDGDGSGDGDGDGSGDGIGHGDGDDAARPVSRPSEVDPPRRIRRMTPPPAPVKARTAPAAAPRPSGRDHLGMTAPATRRVATTTPAPPPSPGQFVAGAPGWHTVASGQTLFAIARSHGCSVAALQAENQLTGTLIRPDQRLRIPTCEDGRRVVPITVVAGQSRGLPWNGRLSDGVQLPVGDGYHIRRPHRAWGCSHVVAHIERAIAAVRARFPAVHTLAIGDLSVKKGGAITDHRSHQSGRDVDIGLYYTELPKAYPRSFVVATDRILDRAATWALLHAFARTADEPTGVSAIFLDYDVQGLLYEWALENGVPASYVGKLFQYPHGAGAMRGLVRHEPNHADHFHIRFRCPPGDTHCG
jgi:LysM repeat protein